MKCRCLVPLVLLLTLAGLVLDPVPAGGQPAAPSWSVPRTPDGQPDLQGIWLNNSATPLERPKALEGRQSLTDDEVAELKQRVAQIFEAGADSDFAGGDDVFLAALANPERFRNPNATNSAYSMVPREFDNRTSLIVIPPDGRVPPLTAEAQLDLLSRANRAFEQALDVRDQQQAWRYVQQAIVAYEQLAASGLHNAKLYYNLGNAYFHLNDLGQAMLYYRRGLRLEPHNARLQANVQYARSRRMDQIEASPQRHLWRSILFWHDDLSLGTQTFLAVLGLFLFGGEVLRGFGFTMVVGILVGTYSTVYIASPIVVWWQKRQSARVPSS